MLDWDDLWSFLYVARHGSLTAAAKDHRLMTSLDDGDGDEQERWAAGIASRAQPGLQTSSHEALVVAARSGSGLACLARFRADRDLSLTRLETPTPPPPAEVCILVHKDSRATQRIQETSAVIAEAVGAFLPG